MNADIDLSKERAVIFFSDLHLSKPEEAIVLAALAQFSRDESAVGITNGDNYDAMGLLNQAQAIQKAAGALGEYPESEQEKIMNELSGRLKKAEQEYVQMAGIVNEVYGAFHTGKVYGVSANHDHPQLPQNNLVGLEGKLLNVGGMKITGIDHYSARFFDEKGQKDPFYNVNAQLRKYASQMREADTILMHEGAHEKLAHDDYHKGLAGLIEGKDIACGHVHSKHLSQDGGRTLLRSSPDTAYFKRKEDDGWQYYELNLKDLVEHYTKDVAGSVPEQERKRAA